MTPREIELLTIAELEQDGHQSEPAQQRDLEYLIFVASAIKIFLDIYYFSFLYLRLYRLGNVHP